MDQDSGAHDPEGARRREHARRPDGRFGHSPAPEAAVDLTDRAQTIGGRGYVPPAYADAASGSGRAERRGFRRAAAATGEYGHPEGDYPKMDPATRRATYTGGGTELTMPSRAAVLRMGQDTGATFDVPVSGGGRQSWVRLTPGDGGRWHASPTASTDRESVRTAEAVCAVMEARRPRTALADAGNLLARRRERLDARGARDVDVTSSWIDSVGYQASSNMMVMRTKDVTNKSGQTRPGRIYGYEGVPASYYRQLATAQAPGRVFNAMIKGSFPRATVDQCGSCGSFHRTLVAHSCGTAPEATARPRTQHRGATPDRKSARSILGSLRRPRGTT